MIIDLKGHIYDTELDFDNQTEDTKNFVNEILITVNSTFTFDDSYRIIEYKYKIDNKYEVVKTQVFSEPAPSCAIESVEIIVRVANLWHEPNYSIQIILTLEQQVNLLRAYPDFALYTSQSNLPTYVEGNKLYTYDNVLRKEYRDLLQHFGGIITDK